MLPSFAAPILEAETNSTRFENFCREVFEQIERRPLVPTSTTYDRGRDARAMGASKGSHPAILCATLNRDIDAKVDRDLRRVAETSEPDRIIYCSSQKLSEDKIDELSFEIRKIVPASCSVLLVGSIQLSNLAEKHAEIFEKHYRSEVRTIQSALAAPDTASDTTESRGLRLALVAFGSEDASALRMSLSKRLILEACHHCPSGSLSAIAGKASTDLCLPRCLDNAYVHAVLKRLLQEKLVSETHSDWSVTAAGEALLNEVSPEAARELLTGRTIIRQRLEELVGFRFTDGQYELVWSTLVDFLSELFHSNGLETIRAVNEFIAPGNGKAEAARDLSFLLIKGAQKIRATTSNTELGEALEQAVMDIFTERSGAVFEWLAKVCERFVALCALGLEATSADEVKKVVRQNHVILDSHVILSLLCESESDYSVTRTLINRWRREGGRILLARPVLEEVAHHAWISQKDFDDTEFLLGKLGKQELRRYAINAFVRAFHFHSKDASEAKNWPVYINQFRGREPNDYSNLLPHLQSELGAEILPDTFDTDLQLRISNYLMDLAAQHQRVPVERLDRSDTGKVTRDARLLAAMVANSEARRRMGDDANVVLLSSSGRLRKAHLKFLQDLGPRAVLSLGTLSYLLSMIPDTQLGAGSLRGALFGFGETAHLQDSERLALRIIRGVGNYEFPWARRKTLVRILDESLRKEAEKRDVSIASFREQFEQGLPSANSAEVIIEAVKSMALADKSVAELVDARSEIKVLEADVESLKALVRTLRETSKSKKPRGS